MWFACILLGGAAAAAPGPGPHSPLLPRPQEVRYGTGRLPVRGLAVRLPASASPEDRFAASELARFLGLEAGLLAPEGAGSSPAIRLLRSGAIDALPVPGDEPGPQSREAYSLSVRPDGVEIRARSSAGLYYGAQTLRQLVEGSGAEAVLPEVEIRDSPSLAFRGVMVDMSHGALPTVDEVERQVDFVAGFKVNQYYLYSEASIELDGYPLLNPDGRFTREQVGRIVEYARRRHVDVVPCLEMYGHLHDLLRVEKYAELAALPHGGELDPRRPEVIRLLSDWAGQLTGLFPSPFVHVGFDETWQIEQAARKQGAESTPAALFRRQLGQVAALFAGRGRKVMAWGDIVLEYPEILADLPPGLIAVAWEYDPQADFGRWLGPLRARGVPTIVATAVSNWREVYTDYDYTLSDIDRFLAEGRAAGAIGAMNTVWSDSSQGLIRAALPAVAYGAVAAWQSAAVDRAGFFADYSGVVYPAAAAPRVAFALDRLSHAESALQKALGQETVHAFWDDPLEPDVLEKLAAHRGDLRQCRLLAEAAQEALGEARRLAPDASTLASLSVSAGMLDYAGLKGLAAVELADRWRSLGPRMDKAEWWKLFASEWEYQSHSRVVDLMDAITTLRQHYRRAWLDEYTEYRLDSTLGRWDAEYQYWRRLQARLRRFAATARDGSALPPLDSLVHGRQAGDAR